MQTTDTGHPKHSFCLVNQVLYTQIEWKMSCAVTGGAPGEGLIQTFPDKMDPFVD